MTQSDVAKALGLGQATVSMALRDDPRITAERRREIQAAALAMGYRRNSNAATLAHFKHHSKTKPVEAALAWLNLWPVPGELRASEEFDRYWRGAEVAAEKFGYHLEEFVVDERLPLPRLATILEARGIEGIFLPPHRFAPDWGDFPWENFAVVRFGRSLPAPPTHVVTADQVANTMLAFEEMRARGYRRIGLVEVRKDWAYGRLFRAGFLAAQSVMEEQDRVPRLLLEHGDPKANGKEMARWLRSEKPDALLIDSPLVPGMLKDCGLRVPEDIGVAATTVLDIPVDAGIHQNAEEVGRVAALTLVSLIHDNDRGIPVIPREVLVSGEWVDGSSLPNRRSVPARQ